MDVIYEIPPIGVEEVLALVRIAAYRRELDSELAQPERWVGPVRRLLAAEAIQRSTGIGGYNVPLEEALAAVESDRPMAWDAMTGGAPTFTTEILGNWNAVVAYRRAMTYVFQLWHDDEFEYTPALLRALHFMMTEYSLDARPGLWRTGPVWITGKSNGEIVYEGPPAEDVPGLVDELMMHLSIEHEQAVMVRARTASRPGDPLVRAAMAHLNLAMIHPFKDGNGRMARALQTLVLAREGIFEPEWCSIEEYLGDNTDAYFRVLAEVGRGRWSPQNDALPWVRFCLQAYDVQGFRVLRRVRESRLVWEQLEGLARRSSLPERSAFALFDASIGLRVTNAAYRNVLRLEGEEIPRQVAGRDLHAMVEYGLLERRGDNRGSYYEAGAPLLAIRRRVTAARGLAA
jgi:Fic family protein